MSATPEEHGEERRIPPTSGTTSGWIGVGLAGIGVVAALLEEPSVAGARFALGSAVFGVVAWSFMLRPRVIIGSTEVELRNALSSWHIPLASVRSVTVRAITRIDTDEGSFDGIAVGRPLRSMRRQPGPPAGFGVPGFGGRVAPDFDAEPARHPGQLDASSVADFTVERILEAADRSRASASASGTPRRTWARLELGLLSALVAGLVVSLLL